MWLSVFGKTEDDVTSNSRVCSRHFPSGNVKLSPVSTLGKRFASPIKKGVRAKRARHRQELRQLRERFTPTPSSSKAATCSRSVTPPPSTTPCIAMVGEQLLTDISVHELPNEEGLPKSSTEVVVNTALLARIEVLEAENAQLKSEPQKAYFQLEDIEHDDNLVRFYTGFVSFSIFIAFFEFLGPVVNHLNYWGSKECIRKRQRKRKLDPKNQLFLTLVKLKLNLKVKDLGFCFGLSMSQVSRYITTWICFLYHHLKEIDWIPKVEQVKGTLPSSFHDKFPTTYAIIDGSEIFIETPSDLQMQSSTWSQYKHHNTAKFLVACTPNGSIAYISPVYVGSISDVDLTRHSGFLQTLADKPGVSIMADRGFTVKEMLKELNIELNIPPFLQGRKQLPSEEVQKGRKIASLRIHVERAIGRIKTFSILKQTIPISMARLTNQIVSVCAFLSNFYPALVPLPPSCEDSDVEQYFMQLSDECNSSDSEDSDSTL